MSKPMWVGRAAELRSLQRALEDGPTVVTGPPGIGKSALLDRACAEWRGEVIRCDLSATTAVEDARAEVASALGVGAMQRAEIGAALRGRPDALLVLDGAERVGAPLAPLVAEWGHRSVLVGCQIRLDLDRTVPVGPLAADEGVALFVSAARRLLPTDLDLVLVRRLVEALDGVPLALLVAASRVRTVPLDDPELLTAVARSGPLAAAIGASLDELEPGDARALGRATSFAGEFDAAGFLTVTQADDEVLERLVDASLIAVQGQGRLRLLQMVRRIAAARWAAEDRAATHARYAEHVIAVADRAILEERRTGRADALEALRADLRGLAPTHAGAATALLGLHLQRGPLVDPTLATPFSEADRPRLALLRARLASRRQAHADGLALLEGVPVDGRLGVELVAQRMHHLVSLGRLEEARASIEALRSMSRVDPDQLARARLAEAVLHLRADDPSRALDVLREGLAAVGNEEMPELRARILAHLGAILRTLDPVAAEVHLREAIEAYTSMGDEYWEGIVAQWLGLQLADRGRLEEARVMLERSTARCARMGDSPFQASAAVYLCQVLLELDRLEEAGEALARATRVSAASPTIRTTCVGHRALILHLQGDVGGARELYARVVDELQGQGRRALAATWRAFLALADPSVPAACGDERLERLLVAARGAGVDPELRAEAMAWGRVDARLLLRLVDRQGVTCAADGTSLVLRDGTRVDLSRRPLLVRLVKALVDVGPGRSLGREALMGAVWPGEKLVGKSGDSRLHVAISTLRKLGVPIVTSEVSGELAYALEPDVRVA